MYTVSSLHPTNNIYPAPIDPIITGMSRSQTPTYVARQSRAPPNFQSSNRNVTPISKQVISLEEWERLAPLDDGQLQSINTVKEKFSEREYPENVSLLRSSPVRADR
jgi:hypothetical protein